ncbi:MAG: hypothetical protein CBC01_04925 [Betaproteobacteria bacterium TMED41]|nr:MAG: hypothetical protein CBC01_04925 [Betaproteobacteria bacterium TMED41]
MREILKEILTSKVSEVKDAKKNRSVHSLEADRDLFEIYDFEKKIVNYANLKKPGIIAEIKKASPSKGVLKKSFDPSNIAMKYELAGAACISILTDIAYFQGSIDDLVSVKKSCRLPVLRKDFVIDPYQVFQSRAYGADCILLIAAALSLNQMIELEDLAISLGMSVLVEVHNESELDLALSCKTNLIGINNRNLNTFDVNLENSFKLSAIAPKNKFIVSESGISSHKDITSLMTAGIFGFLIGEFFMKKKNPGATLKTLLEKF